MQQTVRQRETVRSWSGEAMGKTGHRVVIVGAIAANVAIAVSKFVAAAITGSSAILAEAIHSVVDTGDGCLLLLGEHLSQRPADAAHPFGHGREVYFWSFLVAMVMFGVGGGMSAYEGIEHLVHPGETVSVWWNYGVLGVAFVFESCSWALSFHGVWQVKPRGLSLWRFVHQSKDPSLFTVLLEDSSDLVGLVIAFLGVLIGQLTGTHYADGIASILIGALLAGVSLVLGFECWGLLVGEAADPESVTRMQALAEADPAVERVERPLTMQLAPHQILLNLAVQFRAGLALAEVEAAINRVEAAIRAAYPDVQRIFVEARSIGTARG